MLLMEMIIQSMTRFTHVECCVCGQEISHDDSIESIGSGMFCHRGCSERLEYH